MTPQSELPSPSSMGERRSFKWPGGTLAVFRAGAGAPVLLLHSINAAATSAEVAPLFADLQASRTVFAVDLPGFGDSDRAPVAYDTPTYVDAIVALARDIHAAFPDDRIDLVALSLSCEFAALAALQAPDLFGKLVFVTPTGFYGPAARPDGLIASPRGGTTWPERVLRTKGLSDVVFAALGNAPSVRFFLKVTFGGATVPAELAAAAVRTVRAVGAKHAPLAFASGKLFTPGIRSIFRKLPMPVWVAHGTRGPFCWLNGIRWVDGQPNWSRTRFETGAFPHFEDRPRFMAMLMEFLDPKSLTRPDLPEIGSSRGSRGTPDGAAALKAD